MTRAPTHEPYVGHGQGVDVTIDLDKTQTVAAPAPVNTLLGKAESLYSRVSSGAVVNAITSSDYLKNLPSNTPIPPAAQTADGLDTSLAAAEAIARGTTTGSIDAASSVAGQFLSTLGGLVQ